MSQRTPTSSRESSPLWLPDSVLTSYTIALFCHIVGVLLFVSGIVLAGCALEVARRRDDPAEIALILGLARIGAVLVAAGTIIVLGFGMWLVHLGRFSYEGWVGGALVLFAVALVLGGIGGQQPKRGRQLATRLAADHAPPSAELNRLLNDPLTRLVNYASALAVVGILALMVFKP